ncbi:poly(rC)-binding protein 4-like [Ipomoea triloba]|uniref:poly(rC)-binding protein 4-like n=1 Tax=Ipomoea triloba TaxID=35885 RepID=UPI00125DA677|nr:poly(rC)-binding protein 4-like [Ipomoea triloba]
MAQQAQPIETSLNPNPPPPGAPSMEDDPYKSTTAKRRRDEDFAEATDEAGTSAEVVPPLKKRVKVSQDIVYRIIVPSKQIGKVIGKVGHRIQKIREETRATIKIADAISRHEERVIIISSKDNDGTFCDAENALHQIVTLILKDDDSNIEALKAGAGHVPANSVRFLIAGSQAGGLIGVSGQNIENLRISTGATVTVLAQHQLPLCASAHESDRVVQVSGDIPAVLRAVVEIGCQLRDNPPRQVITISPTYNLGFNRPLHQYVDPNSAEYVNATMLIPEALAGGLIGRCGSNISRIRTESGATIKVYGGKGEQKQRQIHLGGSAQQVALAKQRIDEYVYSQLMLQTGGQQLQETVQLQQSLQLQQTMQLQQPIPDASASLLQGYTQGHGLYVNSNQGGAMMASYPQVYSSTAANQAPAYYGQSYYPAPPI